MDADLHVKCKDDMIIKLLFIYYSFYAILRLEPKLLIPNAARLVAYQMAKSAVDKYIASTLGLSHCQTVLPYSTFLEIKVI